MTIVFTMTARMIAIVTVCAVVLCIVLFFIGIQIGARYVATPAPALSSGAPLGMQAASSDATASGFASAGGTANGGTPSSTLSTNEK